MSWTQFFKQNGGGHQEDLVVHRIGIKGWNADPDGKDNGDGPTMAMVEADGAA